LCEGQAPAIVLHVLADEVTPADQLELTKLRTGLNALAGRRTRQARGTA
jgi:hypothetical protein